MQAILWPHFLIIKKIKLFNPYFEGMMDQIYMGVETEVAGASAAAPIFLPIIKIGIHRKMPKK